MRASALLLMLLVSLLAGCAGQPPKTGTPGDTANANTWSDADLGSFEGFSQALEQSLNKKDSSLFAERVDTREFARRSLASLGLKAVKTSTVNTYGDVLDKTLKGRYKENFAQIKSARFIRLMPGESSDPDEAVSLIRIRPEDGGINYWKIHLRRVNGRVGIVDWFSYSLGDLASRSLGSFVLQAGLAAAKPDYPGSGAIRTYLAAAQSKDPRKQLDAYEQLPAQLKRNSLLMFAHAQSAMKVSQEAYHDALSELAPMYRENDDYALMLVDYYLFNNDYDKAQQAIDAVAQSIGQDAGLDSLHAGIALQNQAYNRAIAYARDGIQRDASYEDNYWVLLDALVYSHNYADAVLVLNILEQGFDYRFDSRQMATLEGYEDFSRSDAFNSWRSASAH